MKLPKIKTFLKLNKSYKQNNKNPSLFFSENLDNNKQNSSNKKNNNFSTKEIPAHFNGLKISDRLFDIEKINKNADNGNETDRQIIQSKNINSYKDMNLPKEENIIENILQKKDNKIKRKIHIIKSSHNLFVNRIFDTNSLGNEKENIFKINENGNCEKDEDKTIVPIYSKIINHIKRNKINNIKRINYSRIINYEEESNKENLNKKSDNLNKSDKQKFHEHHIFFNNCFFGNNSWNNNLLKNILPKNIKSIFKEEELKKIAKNNIQSILEKEKADKIKLKNRNKSNIFRNVNNNYYFDSFFNSDINNFYNNYKNNSIKVENNKNFLSNRREHIDKNKIYYSSKMQKNLIFTPKKTRNKYNIKTGIAKNSSCDLTTVNARSLYFMKSFD